VTAGSTQHPLSNLTALVAAFSGSKPQTKPTDSKPSAPGSEGAPFPDLLDSLTKAAGDRQDAGATDCAPPLHPPASVRPDPADSIPARPEAVPELPALRPKVRSLPLRVPVSRLPAGSPAPAMPAAAHSLARMNRESIPTHGQDAVAVQSVEPPAPPASIAVAIPLAPQFPPQPANTPDGSARPRIQTSDPADRFAKVPAGPRVGAHRFPPAAARWQPVESWVARRIPDPLPEGSSRAGGPVVSASSGVPIRDGNARQTLREGIIADPAATPAASAPAVPAIPRMHPPVSQPLAPRRSQTTAPGASRAFEGDRKSRPNPATWTAPEAAAPAPRDPAPPTQPPRSSRVPAFTHAGQTALERPASRRSEITPVRTATPSVAPAPVRAAALAHLNSEGAPAASSAALLHAYAPHAAVESGRAFSAATDGLWETETMPSPIPPSPARAPDIETCAPLSDAVVPPAGREPAASLRKAASPSPTPAISARASDKGADDADGSASPLSQAIQAAKNRAPAGPIAFEARLTSRIVSQADGDAPGADGGSGAGDDMPRNLPLRLSNAIDPQTADPRMSQPAPVAPAASATEAVRADVSHSHGQEHAAELDGGAAPPAERKLAGPASPTRDLTPDPNAIPAPRAVADPDGVAAPLHARAARAGEPAAPPETRIAPELPVKPPITPRDLHLAVGSGDQRVDVRVAERSGEIHVAVRTPDQRLAGSLRDDLPSLASRLETAGLRAQAWRPGTLAASERIRIETSARTASQNFQEQPGQHGRRQDADRQPPQPRKPQHSVSPAKPDRKDFQWLFNSLR